MEVVVVVERGWGGRGGQCTAQQQGDGGQQRGDDRRRTRRRRRTRCTGRAERQGSFFLFFFFRSGEEMKGVGLNLCLVSDGGDVIMRGQGEQVLPHYCNENDIPPLHQLEKKWQLKCPTRFLQARRRRKRLSKAHLFWIMCAM